MSKRTRTEIVVFRLSKQEKALFLDGPADAWGIPKSDLIRMALRSFVVKEKRRKP